jgi:hypothetical protein
MLSNCPFEQLIIISGIQPMATISGINVIFKDSLSLVNSLSSMPATLYPDTVNNGFYIKPREDTACTTSFGEYGVNVKNSTGSVQLYPNGLTFTVNSSSPVIKVINGDKTSIIKLPVSEDGDDDNELVTKSVLDTLLKSKQPTGDYALASALEPISTAIATLQKTKQNNITPGANVSIVNNVVSFKVPNFIISTTTLPNGCNGDTLVSKKSDDEYLVNFRIPQGDKGDKGDTGRAGVDGKQCTIQIGKVITVGPGNAAKVSNSGTKTDVILDFTLPCGTSNTTNTSISTTASYGKFVDYNIVDENELKKYFDVEDTGSAITISPKSDVDHSLHKYNIDAGFISAYTTVEFKQVNSCYCLANVSGIATNDFTLKNDYYFYQSSMISEQLIQKDTEFLFKGNINSTVDKVLILG